VSFSPSKPRYAPSNSRSHSVTPLSPQIAISFKKGNLQEVSSKTEETSKAGTGSNESLVGSTGLDWGGAWCNDSCGNGRGWLLGRLGGGVLVDWGGDWGWGSSARSSC
jgi:hypothetical protein